MTEEEEEEEEERCRSSATLRSDVLETLLSWWTTMEIDMIASENYKLEGEVEGVRDIIVSHLLESWALQLNHGNPDLVHKMLEHVVRLR